MNIFTIDEDSRSKISFLDHFFVSAGPAGRVPVSYGTMAEN
jgi:hypothetical protein